MADILTKYEKRLKHLTHRRLWMHLMGVILVAMSLGVFAADQLYTISGIMLIVGLMIMLPLIAQALTERHYARQAKLKKGRRR